MLRLKVRLILISTSSGAEVDNLRRFDDSADRGGRCVDERRLRSHFDLFGYLPYLQCEIDHRLVAYCQHNAASNSSLKSRQRNLDLVSADVQIEKLIAALLIRHSGPC